MPETDVAGATSPFSCKQARDVMRRGKRPFSELLAEKLQPHRKGPCACGQFEKDWLEGKEPDPNDLKQYPVV